MAPYLLPELVAALLRSTPRMPLDIEENLTVNLDAMLRSGTIDAAIVALPFDAPGITVTALYGENFRVIVPAKHPWARRRTIRPDELAAQNLLLLNVGHCFRDQVLDACHEFTRPPVQGKEGNSLETIRNMVTSGMGISVLPATALTPKYAMPQVRAIDFAEPAPSRRIVLASRDGVSAPRGAGRDHSRDPEARAPDRACRIGASAVRFRGLRRGMKQRLGRVSGFARGRTDRVPTITTENSK